MSLKRKSSESLTRSSVAVELLDLFQHIVVDIARSWCQGFTFPVFGDLFPEEATAENFDQQDVYPHRPFHVQPIDSSSSRQIHTIFTVHLRHRSIKQVEFEEFLEELNKTNFKELICRSYDRVLRLTDNQWFFPCNGSFAEISGIHSVEWHDGILHIQGSGFYPRYCTWEPFDALVDLVGLDRVNTWDKDGNLVPSVYWTFSRGLRVPCLFKNCVYPALFSKYHTE